jgi:hypothetical protein
VHGLLVLRVRDYGEAALFIERMIRVVARRRQGIEERTRRFIE